MLHKMKGLKRRKKDASQTAPTPVPPMHTLPVTATVSYGGWYPHTALHLSEVYTFLSQGVSNLPISGNTIASLHQSLDLQSVAREAGYMEYIRATANNGVELRYFEDGLYILEMETKNPQQAAKILKDYHDKALIPALNGLFSTGTPAFNPGPLIHQHPAIVNVPWPHPRHFEIDSSYGVVNSQITSNEITVYKTPHYLFIVSAGQSNTSVQDLIEMHIFFREFQAQLEHYLRSQHSAWSDTAIIREQTIIKPIQIPKFHRLLLKQQRLATIATGRLSQMDPFIQNRASFSDQLDLSDHLLLLFHYRFDALEDSFHYLLTNWNMTKEYIQQTAEMLTTLQARSTTSILTSQRFMIMILAVGSLASWFTISNQVTIENQHILSFGAILALSLLIGWLGIVISNHSQYQIKLRQPKTKKSTK